MSKVDIKALLEAGAHFGHKTSRWNPKMRPFIHSSRGGIHIINLEITVEQLEKAVEFAGQVASEGKDVLVVGTKKHLQADLKRIASEAGLPHVTRRWLGGTLTNFATISTRIKRYNQLTEQLQSGELNEEYNKKEVGEFQEERDKLGDDFGGVADMKKLPGALFVADVLNEGTAVREANRLGIPVIGIVDSNSDPSVADYPIAANDDARKTVVLIAESIAEAVQAGKSKYDSRPAANTKEQEEKKTTANEGKKEKPKTAEKTPAKKTTKPAAAKKPAAKKETAKKTADKKVVKTTTTTGKKKDEAK